MSTTAEKILNLVSILFTVCTLSEAVAPVWVAPADGGSTASVNENSPSGTTVFTLDATDVDTSSSSLVYTLRSVEPFDDFFEISPTADVRVKSGATLNAEVTPVYTLTFFVTDGTDKVKSGTLTVTVTDVAEESSVISDLSVNIVQNQAAGFQVVTLDFSPAFTSGVTYALVAANTFFNVDSSGIVITTSTPFSFSEPNQVIEVQATSGANSATATVTIFPELFSTFLFVTEEITTTSIAAGSVIHEPIHSRGAGVIYSIPGGNTGNAFDFSNGIVTVAAGQTLDKSTTPSYTLTLQIEDSGTFTYTLTVNVDEAPAFTNPNPDGSSTASVAENSPSGTTVLTLAAADTEGDSLTYSIRFINPFDDFFEIPSSSNEVVLKTGATLNREVQSTYTMFFTVQDATTTINSNQLVLSITDVVDESSLFSPISTRLVHKQPADVTVLTVSFVEAFPAAGTSYGFVGSAPVYFTIDASGVIKTSSTQLIYSSGTLESVTFKVIATFSELSNSATVDVTVILDTGPEFPQATVNLDVIESSALASTLYDPAITDADGDPLVYSLSVTPSGSAGDVSLDTGTGIITLAQASDYTTTPAYNLTLTATDNTDSLSASVTISLDVKTAPVFVNPDPNNVPVVDVNEGTTGSLYVLSANDEDMDTLTFSFVSLAPNESNFEIVGATLQLKAAGPELDYERVREYVIEVRAEDQTAPTPQSATSSLRLRLINLNDVTPVFDPATYAVSVKEGLGVQTNLVQVTSTDGDEIASTPIYQVSGNSLFNFSGDQFQTTGPLTYDSGNPVITVTIEVVDAASNGNTGQGTIAVTVLEATAPVFSSPTGGNQTFTFPEDTGIGHTILTVLATDADGDTLTYTMPGLPSKFNFAAATRVLTTVATFDFEVPAERLYVLTVEVTDQNGTPNTVTGTVIVQITDVNDNTPAFGQATYTATLESGTTNNDFLTPTASDNDATSPNNQIKYALGGSPPAGFSIDSSTGALTATNVVYSAASPTYTLSLQAQDLNGVGSFNTGTAEALVTIVTVPVMTNPGASTQATASESSTPADVLLTASSTDVDGDIGTYSLVTVTTKFEMTGTNNAELRLATGQSFDFEGSDPLSYLLEIKVTDNDMKSATGTLTLQVTDANDNPPVFGTTTYPATPIIEQVNTAEVVATVTVTDADSSLDDNNVVMLEITAGDPNSLFTITSVSTTVKQVRGTNLVFNDAPYSLTVTARDRNGAAGFLSATTTLTINVRKVPEFILPPAGSTGASISVSENTADTVTLYTLSVSASSALTYSIHSQPVAGLFELSGTPSTIVKLANGSMLDYESRTEHVLVFRAIDTSSLTGSGTLTITVLDENDNPPVISGVMASPYSVLERQQTTTTIVDVDATDADSSANNNNVIQFSITATTIVDVDATDADSSANNNNVIQFSITAGNVNNWFSINSTSGVITAVSNLQHQASHVLLTVLATDRNGLSGALSASTTVTVTIEKIPEFTSPPPSGIVITRPEDTPVTDLIYTIVVSSDTTVTLSINSQNPAGVFELNGTQNNELRLISGQSFDFEGSTTSYTVVFFAVDQVPQTASASLTITITDVNDNDPVFGSFPATVNALERTNTATSVLQLVASDADSSFQDNNVIQYTLTTGDSSLFSVGLSTGLVTAINLDYVTTGSHSLVVTAMDRNGASGARSATAAFTVNVRSEPIWNIYSVPFSVQESVGAGTSAFSVTATDRDGDTIQYSIVGQVPSTPANLFVFNSPTDNQINVGTPGLDREAAQAVASVTLTLRASDGLYSAETTVVVNIEDLNDNTPQFSQSSYTVTISESLAVGDSVINVPATDADPTPGFSTITYSITAGNTGSLFELASSSSSLINVASPLNFVQGSNSFSLTVQASDGTNSATVIVTIIIKTVPSFSDPSSAATVIKAENIPVTEVLYTILATDEDQDTLTYSFSVQPSSATSLFTLGGTGNREFTLGPGQSFNFESSDWPYIVSFAAEDPDGNIANSAPVTVSLTDINDNAPVFATNPIQVPVKTTVTAGTTVATLLATDADSSLNDNNVISYTIISGNSDSRFALVSASGALTLAQTVSLSTPTYELIIRASDGGSPVMTSTVSVSVTVVEPSNPIITSPALGGASITASENLAVGSVVYTIVASDADLDGLSYTILSQTPSMKFELADNDLRLMHGLDYETETSYTLTFEVDDIDGNTANKQTSGQLVINILNENEYPVFTNYHYEVDVMEWQTSAVKVIDLDVTDQDAGAAGTLTLQIIDGNVDGDFTVDNDGCVWTSTMGLTRHKQLYYLLVIQAVDGGTNKRGESVFLRVNVTPFDSAANSLKISVFMILLAVGVNLFL